MVEAKYLADFVVALIVGSKAMVDWRGGKRRDRAHGESQEELRIEMGKGFGRLDVSLAELRTFTGIDNENGMRGELRSLKNEVTKRLDGLEDRERERDRDERQTYDRRRTS